MNMIGISLRICGALPANNVNVRRYHKTYWSYIFSHYMMYTTYILALLRSNYTYFFIAMITLHIFPHYSIIYLKYTTYIVALLWLDYIQSDIIMNTLHTFLHYLIIYMMYTTYTFASLWSDHTYSCITMICSNNMMPWLYVNASQDAEGAQNMWMSHVTHIRMGHVTYTNESCHTYEWVMSQVWIGPFTYHRHVTPTARKICQSVMSHTYEWVMSHTYEWDMSHICVRRVTNDRLGRPMARRPRTMSVLIMGWLRLVGSFKL